MTDQSGAEMQANAQPRGPRIPIRWKVISFAVLLLIVLAVTLGTTGFVMARAILFEQIQARLEAIATGRQKLLLAYADQQLERAALVASRTRFRELAYDQLRGVDNEDFVPRSQKILLDALDSTEGFRAIWLADMQGRVLTATDLSYLDQDYSANIDFQAGQQQKHLGKPFLQDGLWHAYVTAPVTAGDGAPLGVLMVLLDISPMTRFLNNTTGLGNSGEVLVSAPSDGQIRYLFPTRYVPTEPKGLPASDLPVGNPGEPQFFQTTDYRGKPVLAARVAVGYEDWDLEVKMDTQEANEPVMRLGRMLLLFTAVLLIVGMIAAVLMARRFTQPILLLTQSAASVASGALPENDGIHDRQQIQGANDEIGDLWAAFQKMTANLRRQRDDLHRKIGQERATREEVERLSENLQVSLRAERESREQMEQLFEGVRGASNKLSHTASQILKRTSQQSANCTQQAEAVADVSVTIKELDQSARRSLEHAQSVAVSATRAQHVGDAGRQAIYDSFKAIQGCQHQADTIGETIGRLHSHATAISDIILAVSDLAEESNVLALNAAVEASRAGEHGKGFAVVAGEVKSLAEQSKKSTHQVSKILEQINEATHSAVLMADQGRTLVDKANLVIKKSEQTIESLTDTINEAALAGAQIVAATRDQAGAVSQMSDSVESTSRASNEVLKSAQEIESLARELDQLSTRLQLLFGKT